MRNNCSGSWYPSFPLNMQTFDGHQQESCGTTEMTVTNSPATFSDRPLIVAAQAASFSTDKRSPIRRSILVWQRHVVVFQTLLTNNLMKKTHQTSSCHVQCGVYGRTWQSGIRRTRLNGRSWTLDLQSSAVNVMTTNSWTATSTGAASEDCASNHRFEKCQPIRSHRQKWDASTPLDRTL